MNFIDKPKLTVGSTEYFSKPYKKPATCPFCGIGTDALHHKANSYAYRKKRALFVVSMQCTACLSYFIALYEQIEDENKQPQLSFVQVLPQPMGEELHPGLVSISERFAKVHKESQTAELMGLYDLASMGYRKALEIIVKDYAINELGIAEEVVVGKKLANAISTYLNQADLVKTADVVRILGNDRVHYKEEHPELDFLTLKRYYTIFLQLIVTQYEIKHPPVTRKQ